MTYAAKILADSIASGVRLTTLEVTFPRFILAEFNTHRMLSRNSASSRAIPVEKRIEQVRTNPFVPEAFTLNKKGMQADSVLDDAMSLNARTAWLTAAEDACAQAELLSKFGVHKQHANRILEPYVWHTAVVSATEWENFFALRCHPAAQPEMQITARLMRDAMAASTPRELKSGQWHLPYAPTVEINSDSLLEVYNALVMKSVVCCAAVSFERQLAERTTEQIVKRHDDMVKSGHWSPFEHQAKVMSREEMVELDVDWATGAAGEAAHFGFVGNFRAPWLQYRKTFAGEALFHG